MNLFAVLFSLIYLCLSVFICDYFPDIGDLIKFITSLGGIL
jgi:hypothetical protein